MGWFRRTYSVGAAPLHPALRPNPTKTSSPLYRNAFSCARPAQGTALPRDDLAEFRTIQARPKDRKGELVHIPRAIQREHTMYPYSPNTRSLPVPGICFCQTIEIDQDGHDQAGSGRWSWVPGRASVSTERWSRGSAEPSANAYGPQ